MRKNDEKIFETHHDYFTTLFLDYELKPKGILKDMQELSQEILDFEVNVCNKHDLTYWISAGTLLGAHRHKGFIPWDDDMDMGLIRKDYIKLCEVTPDEIKNNNAEDFFTFRVHPMVRENFVFPFTRLECVTENKDFLAGIDITPYEYSKTNEFELKEFRDFRDEFFIRLSGGENIETIVDDMYERFNLDYDSGDYIIKNPTYIRHARHYNKEVACWDIDRFLPVGKIEFNGKKYNCPRDPGYFLVADYDDFMQIPKILIDQHYSVNKLRRIENIDEIYKDVIEKVKECNENFE